MRFQLIDDDGLAASRSLRRRAQAATVECLDPTDQQGCRFWSER